MWVVVETIAIEWDHLFMPQRVPSRRLPAIRPGIGIDVNQGRPLFGIHPPNRE